MANAVTVHAAHTSLPTASASRYLQQLCKHWAHKFPVEFTAERGEIPFVADRRCRLVATPAALLIGVEALDESDLPRLQQVVLDHLKRFAFREEFGDAAWQAGPFPA